MHLTRKQAQKVIRFLRGRPRDRGGVPRVVPVGSYRRKEEIKKDLDLIVQDFDLPIDEPGETIIADARKRRGQAYLVVKSQSGANKHRMIKGEFHPTRGESFPVTLDLFKFAPKDYPYALLAWSGDATYVMHMRAHAKRKGYLLDQYGLFRRNNGAAGRRVRVPAAGDKLTERDIFRFLGYKYKPPTQRISE